MKIQKVHHWVILLALLVGILSPVGSARAENPSQPSRSEGATAYELILAMNTLRVSNGLSALQEDSIIDAVAQSTAEIMAANQMSSHIGNVTGRLSAAGYGGGATVYGTENFAVGNMSVDEVMVVWSDALHMLPATKGAYCNVGAGVAESSNGMTYYVLQAAYVSGSSCGSYTSSGTSGSGTSGTYTGVSQIITPVEVATPDADGKIYHEVKTGQSFWSIAIAYGITIKDLETWNNISSTSGLQVGEKLFIPSSNTAGYATPTPVGMIVLNTPDADGKIVHSVAAYQTLSTIAGAYGVTVDTVLSLNGILIDTPLQIGQNLVIKPSQITPSPTPRPLTPLEKLTPASDGKYYHVVKSGETLSWIAAQYEVKVSDLMAWNGLTESSILQPNQNLLLQVTPPATETPTPGPATDTPTPTATRPTSTPSLTPTMLTGSPTPGVIEESTGGGISPVALFIGMATVIGASFLAILFTSNKRKNASSQPSSENPENEAPDDLTPDG